MRGRAMTRVGVGGLVTAAGIALACAAPAGAADGVQHLKFRYGPITVPAGHNLILVGPVTIEKPLYDGYVTRIRPDLVDTSGRPTPTDVLHLHHAVFANASAKDTTAPGVGAQRFFGSGEEKTIMQLPPGYGLPVKATDTWVVNYMVHNLTPQTRAAYITYDVDYVPATAPEAKRITPVIPAWIDVRNGNAYPVFDVLQHHGRSGRTTYPDGARKPYGSGPALNRWRLPYDATLVTTAGHVHPGGLYTDLDLTRGRRRALLFRSEARYWDPNGPVSWDLSMKGAPPAWRIRARKGDVLSEHATYETRRASWYESMGINLLYLARGVRGRAAGSDPFSRRFPTRGVVTHRHLHENDNHGGRKLGLPDPTKLPNGQTIANGIAITDFTYMPGDFGLGQPFGNPPVVKRGQSLRFGNFDAPAQIYHSITACRQPCNRSIGISYPLANGDVQFDSGNLGYGFSGYTAAANRADWYTPTSLRVGTYTYFCRIHPFMRGAFRVVK